MRISCVLLYYQTCFILVVLASTATAGFTSSSLSVRVGKASTMRTESTQQLLSEPSERTHLSIWLVPPEPQRSQLQQTINQLAAAHGGSPTFTPHLTVVGSVQASTPLEEEAVVEKLRWALHNHPYVNCRFLPHLSSFPDQWNQALIAELDNQDDNEFYQLCCNVRAALDMPVTDWSFPSPVKSAHLSLFYGVGDNVPVLEKGDVVAEEGISKITPIQTFAAHQIQVVRVVSSLESVSDWKCIATIDF